MCEADTVVADSIEMVENLPEPHAQLLADMAAVTMCHMLINRPIDEVAKSEEEVMLYLASARAFIKRSSVMALNSIWCAITKAQESGNDYPALDLVLGMLKHEADVRRLVEAEDGDLEA